MSLSVPKQFILLAGKPVLFHTLEKFHQAGVEIVLVLPVDQLDFWRQFCLLHNLNIPHIVVAGGETRFHSVKNGLEKITEDGLVAIHDGVRPLVSANMISLLFSEAEKYGNAVPALPVTESLRELKNNLSSFADRSHFRMIQTPQCFKLDEIKKAFRQEYQTGFTDEATVAELAGLTIHLVEGEKRNIKITTPEDLLIAEALLHS